MRHTVAVKRSNGQMTTITPETVNEMERQALGMLYAIWRAQGRHELVEMVRKLRKNEPLMFTAPKDQIIIAGDSVTFEWHPRS